MFKRLYVDLETSPNVVYSWRVGRRIDIGYDNIVAERAIICICYKWEGSKKVESLVWENSSDKAMLRKFIRVLERAEEVVAHNGDRFDLPWIRTRCIFHGIPLSAQLPSVDTLKIARSGFLFNSNRLDYLGGFLGHGHKADTGGFRLWKGVMDGNKNDLKAMVNYCARDVELLEKVHGSLYKYSRPKQHMGVHHGGYKHHCPACASGNTVRNGNKWVTAAGTVQVQMRCKDCGRQWRMGEATARREQLREYKAKQADKGLA